MRKIMKKTKKIDERFEKFFNENKEFVYLRLISGITIYCKYAQIRIVQNSHIELKYYSNKIINKIYSPQKIDDAIRRFLEISWESPP